MTLITENLGQVAAIISSDVAPTNTKLIWYDTINNIQKAYNVVSGTWNPMFVLPYKVYSASISQQTISSSSGTVTSGQVYIVDQLQAGDNLTNIGYVSDGVPFTATGTTPSVWTHNTIIIAYNISNPIINILQNTIGTISWERINIGNYKATIPNSNTSKILIFFPPNGVSYFTHSVVNSTELLFSTQNGGSTLEATNSDNLLDNDSIEIRIYN